MRGEHVRSIVACRRAVGSSPHARGARIGGTTSNCVQGIIPACAGSTSFSCPRSAASRDHPRMRGEHPSTHPLKPLPQGSSPHARGAQVKTGHIHVAGRIIPACAGSTCPGSSRRSREGDHPRMRGEHCEPALAACAAMGSSPHARGAHSVAEVASVCAGIIPACAGSTPRLAIQHAQGLDHPRMRGEHASL